MFPQNSRLLNLFRLKNDTKFNLEMLQFYYSHETPIERRLKNQQN